MLAHFIVVMADEFHDNRLRNSRFLQKRNSRVPQGVKGKAPISATSRLFLVIGFSVRLFFSQARLREQIGELVREIAGLSLLLND